MTYNKGKTLGQREKTSEEDEIPNGETGKEELGREHLRKKQQCSVQMCVEQADRETGFQAPSILAASATLSKLPSLQDLTF